MKMYFLLLAFCAARFAQAGTQDFLADLESFRQKSLQLKSEGIRLQSAKDLSFSKGLFWTPSLSATVGKSKSKTNGALDPGSDYWRVSSGLNLFRGGSDVYNWKSANLAETAQEFQIQNEEIKLEQKAADLIFKQLYFSENSKAQTELKGLKEKAFQIATDRYKEGKISKEELLKIQVELSLQKNRLRSALLDEKENLSSIKSLFIDEIKTNSWPFTEETKKPAITHASKQLQLLELSAASLEQKWKATKGLYWPSLDLSLAYQQAPRWTNSNRVWSGSLEMTIPLWSRYETAALSSQAYAAYQSAKNTYTETERQENLRNDFLMAKVISQEASLREAKENLKNSDQLYQDMERAFKMGRLSANDLFLEQNRFIESRLNYYQSMLAFHQAQLENCGILGLHAAECFR